MQAADLIPLWQDLVRDCAARGERIRIHGGGSKSPWWPPVEQSGADGAEHTLDTSALTGIVNYEPTELVVTARAGTPIAEIDAALAAHGQYLPFEPPHFVRDGAGATVGGMVAAGLSGPARIAVGGVRDYVLGASLLNGKGESLRFGGEVMKNVAGFDVSRLLCGSLGSLGVILDVSLKVLPLPPAEATLRFAVTQDDAITRCNTWAGQPLPLNASAWIPDRNDPGGGMLMLRLRGARAAVDAARRRLGGELLPDADAAAFWHGLREQTLRWFAPTWPGDSQAALWRLSLPPTVPALDLPGTQLVEWFGGLRWLISAAPAPLVRDAARQAGGHATRFRGGDTAVPAFVTPLAPLDRIQRQVKAAFDPHGVFPALF